MNNQFKAFKQLHYNADPLIIGNAWNVQSVRIMEQHGLKAVATSSAAVAETLGYRDGEEMSFEEYFFVIRHIAQSTSLPFSVDLEAGYGQTASDIAANIKKLSEVGVVGINIEDTEVKNGKRTFKAADKFTELLKELTNALEEARVEMFINVRCDTFLLRLENAIDEAKKRVKLYEATPIHGVFLPCITNVDDIRTLTAFSKLPINVLAMPGLPSFAALKDAGVKRISMGNFLNELVYQNLNDRVKTVLSDQSFKSLF